MATFDDLREPLGEPCFLWSDARRGPTLSRISARRCGTTWVRRSGKSRRNGLISRRKTWAIGVIEHDESGYYEYAMTFNEWMLAYLKGEERVICSRNFASDAPFFRQLPQPWREATSTSRSSSWHARG